MVSLQIKPNTYYDSITLMVISKELKKVPGVKEALVGMGTDLNLDIAKVTGLSSPELEAITPNDFFVALDCENEEAVANALKALEEQLNKKEESRSAAYYPPTLTSALKADPKINLALISVPGRHAYDVAKDALDKNINVMLFSDNVSMEEEKKLKEYAVSKELLMMGPDCGTAVVNGLPLAFANVIHKGPIGICGASGTGTQELTILIDQLGSGITQALGTGGRYLKAEIGGLMFKQCLNALINDPETKVIIMLSKPPAEHVAKEILSIAKECNDHIKPVVVDFIGGDPHLPKEYGLVAAYNLEDAARKAVALSKGEPIPADMIEAARIDGANPVQMFFRIKLPYLLSVQGPSLVTDFVKNVNNFNVIYLLTQGVFVTQNQALAQSNAKEIDLLVTWLFRLTQDYYNYKMAAVLGIMVFIVCAVFTVVCFHFINKKEATFS